MIDAVSAISSVSALSYARKAAGTDAVFQVPESALRTNEISPAAGVAERDPIVDSAEFSRDFPQILMAAAYAPPPLPQTLAPGSGGVDGSEQKQDAGSENPEGVEGEEAEEPAKPGEETDANGEPLDEAAQNQLSELKARDREVRAHEQAHKSVGGSLAGGVSYEYQQGPDGNKYAVGGEVSIDTSPERDPESTIAKMQQVKAAAMAPAQPSDQDRTVAAEATQTEMEARQQVNEQAQAKRGEKAEGAEDTENGGAENEAGTPPPEVPMSGGVENLSSANQFMNRYAGNAYGVQSFAAAAMSMNASSPLNIVA